MATINHLGLIYQSLDENAAAGKCFQQLLSTLIFLIERCERSTAALAVEFDGSFRNTSHLIF